MTVAVENMSTLVLPKGTAQALRDLTGEPRPDVALLLVLRDALAYRLDQIEENLGTLEEKYGMPFDEYRLRWESEDRAEDYRWEAERDYLEWEALVTQKRRLEDVYSWLN
jgi:hypothetical protein